MAFKGSIEYMCHFQGTCIFNRFQQYFLDSPGHWIHMRYFAQWESGIYMDAHIVIPSALCCILLISMLKQFLINNFWLVVTTSIKKHSLPVLIVFHAQYSIIRLTYMYNVRRLDFFEPLKNKLNPILITDARVTVFYVLGGTILQNEGCTYASVVTHVSNGNVWRIWMPYIFLTFTLMRSWKTSLLAQQRLLLDAPFLTLRYTLKVTLFVWSLTFWYI